MAVTATTVAAATTMMAAVAAVFISFVLCFYIFICAKRYRGGAAPPGEGGVAARLWFLFGGGGGGGGCMDNIYTVTFQLHPDTERTILGDMGLKLTLVLVSFTLKLSRLQIKSQACADKTTNSTVQTPPLNSEDGKHKAEFQRGCPSQNAAFFLFFWNLQAIIKAANANDGSKSQSLFGMTAS
uniref:Uncharacterized protein n=1 Tax=Oryza brachyantha TaxID=4533 RepID=J3MN05_ORYBR